MKTIILLLSLIAFALAASTCNSSCYSSNTYPCPHQDFTCLKNPLTGSVVEGCDYVCVNRSAAALGGEGSVEVQARLCKIRCAPSSTPMYKCDPINQECVYDEKSGCETCQDKCDRVNCLVSPCSVDAAGKECAARVAGNNPGAVIKCVDNYCGGCVAEWYVDGRRVCEKNTTCTKCEKPCPAGTKPVVDVYSGCDVCDKCRPVCEKPDVNCLIACPYGYMVDEKGCFNCSCRECPPESFCKIYCPYGNVIDRITGCKKCECNNATCPQVVCDNKCDFGYVFDEKTGCQTCECKKCERPNCTNVCLNGYKRDEKTGCPTCECLPRCLNVCPYGYDFYSNDRNSTAVIDNLCKCKCSEVYCLRACEHGYIPDENGCRTCNCIEKYNNCSDVTCAIYCPYGNVLDEKGCATCKCNEPPVCPNVTCPYEDKCIYGTSIDSRTRCRTCDCQVCPAVKCARYCEYGYQTDPKTGCPTCVCNEKPKCPRGIEADGTFACNLKCEKGYVYENGCPICRCVELPPCQCTEKPRDEPKLCPDNKTNAGLVLYCNRSTDGKVCRWVRSRCPIGIKVVVSSVLTEDEILRIRIKLGLSEGDFSYTIIRNSDGTVTYIIWSNRDGLDPAKDDPSKVNSEVDSTVKETKPDAVSSVYEATTTEPTTSFANVVVPFLGLVFLMMLFI